MHTHTCAHVVVWFKHGLRAPNIVCHKGSHKDSHRGSKVVAVLTTRSVVVRLRGTRHPYLPLARRGIPRLLRALFAARPTTTSQERTER